MNRSRYYDEMKFLACEVRRRHGITTRDVSLSTLRSLYRAEGISLHYWHHKLRKVRAAYFLFDGEPHVMVNAQLPKEPRVFALCHELKHHYADRQLAERKMLACEDPSWQTSTAVEIGAEIFAAELIYPEKEFLALARDLGLDKACSKEDVVRLKRAVPPPVSYTFLQKRLQWFGFIEPNEFKRVRFQKLEEQLYGVPFYRRARRGRRGRPSLSA